MTDCSLCKPKLVGELPPFRREIPKTLNVALYELGNVAKAVTYAESRPAVANAYLADAKLELSDLITQCRILAEHLEVDFRQLVADGEDRFMERMKEVRDWQNQNTP